MPIFKKTHCKQLDIEIWNQRMRYIEFIDLNKLLKSNFPAK